MMASSHTNNRGGVRRGRRIQYDFSCTPMILSHRNMSGMMWRVKAAILWTCISKAAAECLAGTDAYPR